MKKTIVVILMLVSVAARGREEAPDYAVTAPLLSSAPTIDGRLDEPVWDEAALLDRFTQIDPEEGASATERTEVRIGYDRKKLYFGVRCYYSDPKDIVAITMERDARLLHEDSIQLILDTYLDRQDAFFFAVTALGAQHDAVVRNNGGEIDQGWDGIWQSITSRDEEGWSAEIAIPFRTLRFPQKEFHTWGFNILRSVVHKRENTVWKPLARAATMNSLFQVADAGELRGLEDIEQGRTFDVKPYVVARADRHSLEGRDTSFDGGIDVKKALTSNLALNLSYNRNFSEAERDQQRINLTRFPQYFAEKRDFFFGDANLFYLGERPDPGIKEADKIFFFSRRIGLTDDGRHAIPIVGGAEISGQIAGTSVGLVNWTTDDHTYTDRSGVRQVSQTNYTALRLRRAFQESSVGLLWLNQDVAGGIDTHGTGVDWELGLTQNLRSGGFLAQTSTPGLDGADWAGMVDLVWTRPQTILKGSYAEIGEEFNPEMGFFPRRGIREWRGSVLFDLRPEMWNLRNIFLANDFIYITDRDGNVETQYNRLVTDFMWKNFVLVAFEFRDEIQGLKTNFRIHDEVVIPPGEYHFQHYFFGIQSIPAKPFFAYARLAGGEFYDGRFKTYFVGLRLRPIAGLTAQVEWEQTEVDLPAGEFEVQLTIGRFTYSVSPRLSFRGLVQWYRDDNFDAQVMFDWRYRPGASFYVVYDEFRDLTDSPRVDGRFRDRALIAKMGFFF
ncbi:MAG: carbohydrate binding family 9 domain-containing protein [bacterium]|nr:carbohydrate binding family 9 domain-containing protein [bacterium]